MAQRRVFEYRVEQRRGRQRHLPRRPTVMPDLRYDPERELTDADARARIPDPQDEATFLGSRLDWSESTQEPHASTLRLYQRLLALRRQEPALRDERFVACALTEHTLLLRQDAEAGPSLLAVIQMGGASTVDLRDQPTLGGLDMSLCQLLFTTEDRTFAPDPHPPAIEFLDPGPKITFTRPSAVLLSVWPQSDR